jgi:hypothetical protein
MDTKAIPLTTPITGHNGPISKVVVKEPTGRDYFALGEPSVWARNPDGTSYVVENTEVLEKYIERCIVEPNDPLILSQLGLADAMRVREAVLDFFGAARRASSPVDSTSSSST